MIGKDFTEAVDAYEVFGALFFHTDADNTQAQSAMDDALEAAKDAVNRYATRHGIDHADVWAAVNFAYLKREKGRK